MALILPSKNSFLKPVIERLNFEEEIEFFLCLFKSRTQKLASQRLEGKMNLRNLSDQELHDSGKRAVKREREATIDVLHHLMEVDRRKMFCKWRRKDLQEYAEIEYGYPGDQAYLRISAMNILREFPEIEEQVTVGGLSLTHLNYAKRLFNKKEHTHKQKLELLNEISGTSTRKAQRIIARIDPEIDFKEMIKPISEERSEYRFTADADLEEKIKELKGRLAHTHPHISMGELFEMLVNDKIEALKEEKVKTPKVIKLGKQKLVSHSNVGGWPKFQQEQLKQQQNKDQKELVDGLLKQSSEVDVQISVRTENESSKENKHTNLSMAEISRQVWARDKYICTNCESTYGLEADHIIPKAKGGPYTLENLRLLCRNCNQRWAIENYGVKKMNPYLRPTIS